MADERVLNKIRALLAKTEGNGCTPEEAESAFAMAQALMRRHQVEEAELIASGQAVSEEIVQHRVKVGARDEIRRAKLVLLSGIAKANDCRIVDATGSHGEVWIVGHESSAFFVEILASSVLMQYAVERNRGWKAYWGPLSRHRWVQSFSYGYACRIYERLEERAEETVSAGAALVLASKGREVEEWMDSNLALRETKRRAVELDGEAYGAGQDAGDRADLTGGRNHVRDGSAPAGELG